MASDDVGRLLGVSPLSDPLPVRADDDQWISAAEAARILRAGRPPSAHGQSVEGEPAGVGGDAGAMTKPDPYLDMAEALLPQGRTVDDVLNAIGVGEISFEQRIALVQAGTLISIARSLRSIDHDRL